jgi:hypothetical protein
LELDEVYKNWMSFTWFFAAGDEVEALPSQILSTWHCLNLRLRNLRLVAVSRNLYGTMALACKALGS